jgi:Tfp pilus assembly protein PilP
MIRKSTYILLLIITSLLILVSCGKGKKEDVNSIVYRYSTETPSNPNLKVRFVVFKKL